ncbi:Aspartate aminotransferase [Fundidesulfovibrio magnetotacticus]|uniref:Aminotransferase n=1 Tax=Fundidesulfovibrio magnetotacticus TaxID=2730080 RepID=A0A6V8LZV4_9BACT|nr:pyridoxal phosphate-dependent aminotransferase [Fundidesulfovibrio magnetotacticus]GFK96071.1 Aspartate aminotransferase [Fundidesulfovibrio magnetotacticus]
MTLLSAEIADALSKGSWIRRIFEMGAEMKKLHGADRVYDFSLGNPDLPSPPVVGQCLAEMAERAQEPFAFGYMPNAGYPHVREALAEQVSREQGMAFTADDLLLTCGAAGGINAFFRAVLTPGDEVLCPRPYFVEYGFYVGNHGGKLVTAPAKLPSFDLDVPAMLAAVTERTRVIMLNSPNNPTGRIYSEEALTELARGLKALNAKREKPILILADEPYRFLAYGGATVPSLPRIYPYTAVASSFSKNLSLAGERIGYVAVCPTMPGKEDLMAGIVFANRILGYVNAPAIGQAILLKALGSQVDASVYEDRRAAMAKVLADAGYEFHLPEGAFYFFPKAPGGDDVAFVGKLRDQRVLAVPGSGFGLPGYFRLTFCVDRKVIENAAEGFARAIQDFEKD